MVYFNRNDPRYRSCCYGTHVTTLSRIFTVLLLLCYYIPALTIEIIRQNYYHLLGIPIVLLGVYGVFYESRTPIFVHIVMGTTMTVVWMLSFQAEVAPLENYPDIVGLALPTAVCICLILAGFQFVIYMTFWNLAKFIKDRESSEVVKYRSHDV
ncbi:hypothetical protein PRIPAC_85350 [Pristionchus pacificus]|uniref:Uncharacterized protein n=1 Tax=Pristionchus pacificus TaxID=54126 RepID=A0A2A6BTQ7_PRIPA|nr:hypothetical protein PRIPAC_85350 [Pristionchus pacificus]|eukprot:PDM69141.1 hypothetical protein PRIPAC_47443 [Pristionchus pacificus]